MHRNTYTNTPHTIYALAYPPKYTPHTTYPPPICTFTYTTYTMYTLHTIHICMYMINVVRYYICLHNKYCTHSITITPHMHTHIPFTTLAYI